ncbi:MAG: tetratricopeptide repeat protein [Candidatus Eremiobacteraeota bacterium]|nr:tetratricopeptide repeat protein [Candidatus Eremiobacteraeota bacterium]
MFVHRLKLRRPQLQSAWIERSDVERRFGAGASVLAIVAGPGYGKTVLATQIAAAWKGPSFWYELDAADRDLTVFAAHADAMLQAPAAHAGDAPRSLASASPAQAGRILADALVDLDGPLVVFDDAHLLEGSATLGAVTAFVERGIRAGATFVLCGRSMPIPLHSVAALDRLATAGPADLAFDATQTRAYLQSASPGAELATLERLAERTEGWPAGLALVASATFGSAAKTSPRGAVPRAEATREVLFNYLATEVLDDLPSAQRRLLVETSILEVLERDVCDAVVGGEQAGDVLASLAARGLFITKRTDDGFAAHRLFREFLRHELHRTYDRDDVARLHRRAADAFRRRDDVESEIDHLLLAGDLGNACAVLERSVFAMLSSGLVARAGSFLERLGDERIEGSATLLAARGRLQESHGEIDAALGSLERAIAMARERREYDVLADTIRIVSPIFASRGEFERISALLQQSLALPLSKTGRARLSVSLAALHLDSGRYDEALSLFDRTMPGIVELGDLALQGVVLHNMAVAHVRRGDPYAALPLYERALAVKVSAGQRISALVTVGNLMVVLRSLGDLERAERLSGEMLRDARDVGNALMLAHSLENVGSVQYARGNFAGARETLDEARRTCDPSDVWYMPDVLHRLGEVALATGDAEAADEYCLQAAKLLATTKVVQRRGPVLATRAECAFEAGDVPRAIYFAREALEAGRDGPDAVATASVDIEVAALLARRLNALRGTDAAEAERLAASAASEGMALVYERDYRFLLRTKASLLGVLAAHLTRWRGNAPVVDTTPARSPNVRIEMLGGLRVFVDGEAIAATAWKRRKAPAIFAYLVTEGGRVVPRSRLVDLYWPELEADAAHDNLRVTIGAIRKALGDVVKFEANGYRFVPPARVWIDVAAFDAHMETGRAARARGDEETTRLAYVQVADLYRGDFVEGIDDGGWQWRERERLRAVALEALRWLSNDATRDAVFRRLMLERLLEIAPFEIQAVRQRLDLLVSELRFVDASREYEDWKRQYRNAVGRQPPEIWQGPGSASATA